MDIWSRRFAGQSECLVEVRRFTDAVLGDCDGAHTVALVADELAGNAIKHTASGQPGGEFVLRLAVFGGWCRVRIDDQGGPTSPAICCADDDDEAGRGLTIVAQLCARWGVDGDERSRSVWADIVFGPVPAISGSDGPQDPAVDLPHQARVRRRVGMTTEDWNR